MRPMITQAGPRMSIQGSDCKKIQKKPHSGKLATFTRPEYKYLYLIMAAVDHSSEFSPGHCTVSPGFEKGTSFGSKIAPFRKLNDMSTHVVFGPGTNVAWRPAPVASRGKGTSQKTLFIVKLSPFAKITVPDAFLLPTKREKPPKRNQTEAEYNIAVEPREQTPFATSLVPRRGAGGAGGLASSRAAGRPGGRACK